MDEAPYDRIVTQTSGLKAALKSLLLLDKAFISNKEASDPEVAAAITAAFATHVPGFDYNQQSNTAEAKFMVDNASRAVCLEIAEAAALQDECVMSHQLQNASRASLPQLLDLARCLAAIMLADATLFLSLISDVAEASAIDDAPAVFQYLEDCVPFLKAKFSFEAPSAPTKLVILRICNMLLRRLSRAHHVLLAGRIHIFLAQILPSTDRSAVNANGSVNESHALDMEEVNEEMLDTEGKPINAAFYKQFWSLQQVFQNPTRAIEPNLWLQVQANIKAVLQHFGRVKATVASGALSAAQGGGDSLTVKYLNSPKLLHLQVRDAGFRRHFLVQCIILIHACSRKSLARQDTFKIKQQGEADDLQVLLYKELERTPQNGLQFARAIRQLMHHEDQWADWKLDGAASFERPSRTLSTYQPPAKRRRVSRPKQTSMGTRELTRLWNLTPDNLSAIHKSHRKPRPTLREFLDPVIQEMDPEQGIEDQYKKQREPVYRWEALRQISKVSRATLMSLLKAKDQSLEQAAHLLLPEAIPSGASQKSAINVPEASDLPVPGTPPPETADADSLREPVKVEDGELSAGQDPSPGTRTSEPIAEDTVPGDVDMDRGQSPNESATDSNPEDGAIADTDRTEDPQQADLGLEGNIGHLSQGKQEAGTSVLVQSEEDELKDKSDKVALKERSRQDTKS